MLSLATFVLAGSALATSASVVQRLRRGKSACRAWLTEGQVGRDRVKRKSGSLLLDGIHKKPEPLFGQTRSRQL
jgi:hypothetical protein